MRTQNEVLKEMMVVNWVNPMLALQYAKCFRLAARVAELKATGVQIVDRWETLPTGKKVKAYRLAGSWQAPH